MMSMKFRCSVVFVLFTVACGDNVPSSPEPVLDNGDSDVERPASTDAGVAPPAPLNAQPTLDAAAPDVADAGFQDVPGEASPMGNRPADMLPIGDAGAGVDAATPPPEVPAVPPTPIIVEPPADDAPLTFSACPEDWWNRYATSPLYDGLERTHVTCAFATVPADWATSSGPHQGGLDTRL